MSDKTRKIAVLTGDLVNSTGLGPEKVERAFVALEDCAEMQAEWMGGQDLHFTRHRGDGWQVALAEPKYALRSALCFRAALRALGEEFDSYIGIAEGDVEGDLDADLNEETSTVFAQSGTALKNSYAALEAAQNFEELDTKLVFNGPHRMGVPYVLTDAILSDWTPTQSKVVSLMLHPVQNYTYTELADKLRKSRQAVTKSLNSAHFKAIFLALQLFEKGYQQDA